ncbi:MAG: DUF1064 domain-containing protein [Burkholderiales bacterium]|nr:DUF1064 domain-containing protein [Burkholderiales bacterium]
MDGPQGPEGKALKAVDATLGLKQAAPLPARPSLTDWRDHPRQKRHEKYSNVRCEFEGQKFDSKAELKRWLDLRLLLRAREITNLERQVSFELVPKTTRPSGGVERAVHYIADFVYTDRRGLRVVEDVKGAATPEYRLKRKLMLHVHGIEIREIKA